MVEALTSGMPALDQLIGGIPSGSLTVLSSHRGEGRTALALSVTRNVARRESTAVAYFSTEHSKDWVTRLLLAGEALLSVAAFDRGIRTDSEWTRTVIGAGSMADWPLMISDCRPLKTADLLTLVRGTIDRLRARESCDSQMIVLDSLDAVGGESGEDEISEIVTQLSDLAAATGVAIVATISMNGCPEELDDPFPCVSRIRGCEGKSAEVELYLMLHRGELRDRAEGGAGETKIVAAQGDGRVIGEVPVAYLTDCALMAGFVPARAIEVRQAHTK